MRPEPWSVAELDDQFVEVLPARETLFFNINISNIIAVNMAIAVNAASIGSVANALAVQQIAVGQH